MNQSIQSILLLSFLVFVNILTSINGHNNYEKYVGYKIYEIRFQHENQYLKFYKNFPHLLDTSTLVRNKSNGTIQVVISPNDELKVLKYLYTNSIVPDVINNNVAEFIRNERSVKETKFYSTLNTISFQSYQRLEAINNYMDYLKEQYPERVKIMNIGKSYEDRDLRIVLITNNTESHTSNRSVILIDAGIHAREWIAPATALFVMQQLVENSTYYEKELEMYDWLIWPIVNPDGYVYSHDYDRLWRKNRRPSESTNSSTNCVGADLNRNFDFYWSYAGVSNNPCSDIYPGVKAFSDPESQALRDLLLSINTTCQLYLTLHSYGNYLLYPWGYQGSVPPSSPYLDAVARSGSRTIKSNFGTTYTVGGAANVLYPASGASDDYAFAIAKIPVVVCMELPSGGNGFDPPSDKIQTIVAESWSGIRAMALEANDYPLRNSANCKMLSFTIVLCAVFIIWN